MECLHRARHIRGAHDERDVHLGRALRDHLHLDVLVSQRCVHDRERRGRRDRRVLHERDDGAVRLDLRE